VRPLLVTSGEPAGIGPDLCLALAGSPFPLVVIGDKNLLASRAKQLGLDILLTDYQPGILPTLGAFDNSSLESGRRVINCQQSIAKNQLVVLSIPCVKPVIAGVLEPLNSSYVLEMLTIATERCLKGEFSALITAPVQKSVINQAGIPFTGHTEFLRDQCKVSDVVMMLACEAMKVALVTTHIPLHCVPSAITESSIINVITKLNESLQNDFGIKNPKIYVAGLNPHAGESGYLGTEEIDIITPTLSKLKQNGINVNGPLPADTMFTQKNLKLCDAFVAMYHDQGLSVLKYAGFGKAVNITLGLPIIRTSVDHGTALELAGLGSASPGSLLEAVAIAANIVKRRETKDAKD